MLGQRGLTLTLIAHPKSEHGVTIPNSWLHQWQGGHSMQSDHVPRREEPKFLYKTPYFCSSHFLDGSPCLGDSKLLIHNKKSHSLCSMTLRPLPLLRLDNLSSNCCIHLGSLPVWLLIIHPWHLRVIALKSQSTQVIPSRCKAWA